LGLDGGVGGVLFAERVLLDAQASLRRTFGVGELMGRIKAVLRRARWLEPSSNEEQLVRGDIRVDMERHLVTVKDSPVELTPTEFNLLVYLLKHAGRVLSHRVILQNVWGMEYGNEAEYLRVYIGRLRQKIEVDALNPRHLFTEHGMGYRFEG